MLLEGPGGLFDGIEEEVIGNYGESDPDSRKI